MDVLLAALADDPTERPTAAAVPRPAGGSTWGLTPRWTAAARPEPVDPSAGDGRAVVVGTAAPTCRSAAEPTGAAESDGVRRSAGGQAAAGVWSILLAVLVLVVGLLAAGAGPSRTTWSARVRTRGPDRRRSSTSADADRTADGGRRRPTSPTSRVRGCRPASSTAKSLGRAPTARSSRSAGAGSGPTATCLMPTRTDCDKTHIYQTFAAGRAGLQRRARSPTLENDARGQAGSAPRGPRTDAAVGKDRRDRLGDLRTRPAERRTKTIFRCIFGTWRSGQSRFTLVKP